MNLMNLMNLIELINLSFVFVSNYTEALRPESHRFRRLSTISLEMCRNAHGFATHLEIYSSKVDGIAETRVSGLPWSSTRLQNVN